MGETKHTAVLVEAFICEELARIVAFFSFFRPFLPLERQTLRWIFVILLC